VSALAFGTLLLGITAPHADAANIRAANNFGAAPLLPPGNGAYSGDNATANRQPGEPDHVSGAGGGATVWYNYRRATGATIQLTLQGSNFDTELAVYRGNAVNDLTEVASNDDVGDPSSAYWSLVEFHAQANVTYHIVIDGYNDSDAAADRPDTRRGHYVMHVTRLL
jgi:hypothetical protein